MPKALEEKLFKHCDKMGWSRTGSKCTAYVYGTLRKTGWKPKGEKK